MLSIIMRNRVKYGMLRACPDPICTSLFDTSLPVKPCSLSCISFDYSKKNEYVMSLLTHSLPILLIYALATPVAYSVVLKIQCYLFPKAIIYFMLILLT